MYDSIEIISAILSLVLILLAIISLKAKQIKSFALFAVIALWPLMWAGFIRLPIPQTLIWMGMNILAIVFLWQAISGSIFKSVDSQLISMPNQLGRFAKNLISLFCGLAFVILLILVRI